jgi:vacuolar-type H+-ATPase subunit I/STV1
MSKLATVTRDLIQEIVPKVLFFFVAFMLLFLLFKLFVEQYSIAFSAFTKAAVAALVLGKVVPLLDWAGARYAFGRPRRIVGIAVKTLVYALVVIVLGTAERVFSASRDDGTVRAGFDDVMAHAELHRFLGLVLLLSLVVGAYLTAQEISRALGQGGLLRLLLERPPRDEARG